MSKSRSRLLPGLLLVLCMVAAYRMTTVVPQPIVAAAQVEPQWEYQTASVELGSLTPKLIELANNHWDVVNIISTDTLIDQQPDGKTHIVTQRVEVTSRRKK